MITPCFNAARDYQRTSPGLAVDLQEAVSSGTIVDAGDNSVYNDISDPTGIAGRVDDTFSALRAQKSIFDKSAAAAAAAAASAAGGNDPN